MPFLCRFGASRIAPWLAGCLFLYALPLPGALAQPSYTVAKQLSFADPSKSQRSLLYKGGDETVRDIVREPFSVAAADLNDDGVNELFVSSQSMSWCGSLGCWTYVLQKVGNKWTTLANFQTDGGIGITNEKTSGYRSIAILDGNGNIANLNRERHGPSVIPTAPHKK